MAFLPNVLSANASIILLSLNDLPKFMLIVPFSLLGVPHINA